MFDAYNKTPAHEPKCFLSGVIESGSVFSEWDTIKLVQPNGYRIDLVLRLQEWVGSYGQKVSIRYWVTDKPVSLDQAPEGFIRSLGGSASVALDSNEYSYSEVTSGVDYDTELKVGGHDLFKELQGKVSKHLWLEISRPTSHFKP